MAAKKKVTKKAAKKPSDIELAARTLMSSIRQRKASMAAGQKACRLMDTALAGGKFPKEDLAFIAQHTADGES